jgi:hypothetical protein
MIDPPFKRRSKSRQNSIESTSTKESDDKALAPSTMTRKKKLKKIQKLAPSLLSESLSLSDAEAMNDNVHTSKIRDHPVSKTALALSMPSMHLTLQFFPSHPPQCASEQL